MADDARYVILRPQGQDGPFSRADLVRLAEMGRLQADERILDAVTSDATTAGELLPGIARTGTEARIRRRSTSDRLPAQSEAPRPCSARTPLPEAPSAPSADDAPAPSPPAAARRRPAAWSVALVIAAGVFLAVAAVRLASDAARHPAQPLLPAGVWQARAATGPSAAWRIEVAAEAIAIIAADGRRHESAIAGMAADDARCVVELSSPHPVLGRRLVLTETAVGSDLGELPAQHAPPL